MITKEEFAERLKRIKKEKGINRKQLSELTGISKVQLTNLEKGRNIPKATTIAKIANYTKNYFVLVTKNLSLKICGINMIKIFPRLQKNYGK
jgi:transcriptional regulator with XRE-family HTH domain